MDNKSQTPKHIKKAKPAGKSTASTETKLGPVCKPTGL